MQSLIYGGLLYEQHSPFSALLLLYAYISVLYACLQFLYVRDIIPFQFIIVIFY